MKILTKVSLDNRLQVVFDDGSVWSCDRDGTNWRKQELSLTELQAKFDDTQPETIEIAKELKQDAIRNDDLKETKTS